MTRWIGFTGCHFSLDPNIGKIVFQGKFYLVSNLGHGEYIVISYIQRIKLPSHHGWNDGRINL
tara:strand:+ start:247 stop:435 length:189 start_codon:yes stop_codon:yes gene_type:complete